MRNRDKARQENQQNAQKRTGAIRKPKALGLVSPKLVA